MASFSANVNDPLYGLSVSGDQRDKAGLFKALVAP
jgi:hypothetical protein